ncbi:helix-turn-helix protein [Streptomyces sp. KhCrAH-43]|uniref:helix-turn-helix domain-containing protein n=1 Tax=unclassified Streptomyces TaxID=2593676 RepID=UPI00036A0B37|nr:MULTISPECIES: helix-turn-helix transcriptional regulator [unclassified Streptomyces]MYS36751.1 helix-turn-helix domain-containing protein [Streptomyces sp. SID4920]MYX69222.1 helix-turn-helix domain-containing protein [Streptomyces sp. SID8373]RAJ62072.1 helix-turn-helix protein [Streptomyces sp. KhCrAH-43]
MSSNRYELGDFLKARRAELTPRAVGLPDSGGLRRVAGLRREEVAQLAAISTDYYTRLEQGRLPASAPVLETIAEALHLDEDQRRYLFGLAGKETAKPRRRTVQKVQPQLRRVLDDLTSTPAIVMGRRMDVIAWNPLAAAMITDFGAVPEKHRNYVRILFTDPMMRRLYADWKSVARTAVAQLRMEAAKYPDDPRLTALVGELSVRDPDFRTWWAAHHVATLSVGTKVLHHPVAGELSLDWDTLSASTDPDQQLVVWTAEVGSPTHDGLRILASWAADRQLTADPAD